MSTFQSHNALVSQVKYITETETLRFGQAARCVMFVISNGDDNTSHLLGRAGPTRPDSLGVFVWFTTLTSLRSVYQKYMAE